MRADGCFRLANRFDSIQGTTFLKAPWVSAYDQWARHQCTRSWLSAHTESAHSGRMLVELHFIAARCPPQLTSFASRTQDGRPATREHRLIMLRMASCVQCAHSAAWRDILHVW